MNLNVFAKERGLNQALLWNVLKGKTPHYQGWTLPGKGLPENSRIGPSGHIEILKKLEDPNGTIFEFYNTQQFCNAHNLDHHIGDLFSGRLRTYHGWSLPGNKPTRYIHRLQSPEGVVFEFTKIAEFAREHDLDGPLVTSVLHGNRNTHKGWCRPGWKPVARHLMNHTGQIVEFYDVKKFARQNNLNLVAVKNVLSGGTQKQHKGWHLPGVSPKRRWQFRIEQTGQAPA